MVIEISTPQQDDAWIRFFGVAHDPRLIQIGGDDYLNFTSCGLRDRFVGSSVKPNIGGLDGVVSHFNECNGELGWQLHIDEKLHRTTSTVSSSARKAE